jgi:signal transduction histidine kinase
LVAVTLAGLLVAFAVCAALVAVSTKLHRTTATTATAVRGTHLAEEMEASLRRHGRSSVPRERARIAEELATSVSAIAPYVTTPRGRAALADVERTLGAYLDTDASDATLREEALAALDDLVAANLDKTRAAVASAEHLDRLASNIALGVAVVLLPLAGALLWWVLTRAFQPVFALAQTMARFGRGDRDARAAPAGPVELRVMGERFNEMADALAAQRATLLAFLGGIAHDLRTPLSTLSVAFETLHPDRPLPAEPALRRKLALLKRQVVRLDRMVTDLLDTAHIEAGRLELRVQTEDVRALVRGVGELFAAASPHHHLHVTVPETNVPVRCDPVRIEQVLTNLVSNAIKYSPAGGDVELELAVAGPEAVFRVSDHGIGLTVTERAEMFQPFRRAGRAKDTAPGVGLGLSVVKRIVDAHGGHIEVDSDPGHGATFRVFVPLAPA